MLKNKRILLTILLALVAIMLLQLQVNATEPVIPNLPTTGGGEGNVSEYLDSEYDYFLTESNKVLSKAELSDETNAEEYIVACIMGGIDDSADQIFIKLEEDALDESGKILDSVAQRICEFIPYVSGYGLDMSVPNNTIIPASIFAKLKSCNNTYLCMWDNSCQFTFYSSDIENTNVDFKIGVEFSSTPMGNMTVLERAESVEYIKFKNTGSTPGKVEIHRNMGEAEEGEPDESCYIIIESFDENTKSYEYFDQVADPYKTLSMLGKGAVLYPQGGYAIYHGVAAFGDGEESENWCVETEVDSLVWTEEDINKILAAIEETRNNTTDKKLYIHVPSESKVPAKIFEAAKGIDISIISEDGIWAKFSGGSYKAIDYVAGGTISNKAIDGMVNVGEDTIVYLSLKHEGQLPAKCYISYLQGHTEIGLGGEFNTVKTKLYYFNKDVQKYELCGTGWMDLAYDLYVFEIDHCSSYVMSEEALPDEFVIASTQGEDKEETKKEEVKEDTKKEDKTKAPGSLPNTGGTFVIIASVLAIVIMGIYAYKRNKDLRGI